MKAMGVILLILFFTFGFFLNPNGVIDESELNRKLSNCFQDDDIAFNELNSIKITSSVDTMVTVLPKDNGIEQTKYDSVDRKKSR
jgi:hypothetical protein